MNSILLQTGVLALLDALQKGDSLPIDDNAITLEQPVKYLGKSITYVVAVYVKDEPSRDSDNA